MIDILLKLKIETTTSWFYGILHSWFRWETKTKEKKNEKKNERKI